MTRAGVARGTWHGKQPAPGVMADAIFGCSILGMLEYVLTRHSNFCEIRMPFGPAGGCFPLLTRPPCHGGACGKHSAGAGSASQEPWIERKEG